MYGAAMQDLEGGSGSGDAEMSMGMMGADFSDRALPQIPFDECVFNASGLVALATLFWADPWRFAVFQRGGSGCTERKQACIAYCLSALITVECKTATS